ncbi:MAG: paraquat-inducible protein A [Candidatus Thiodiazotropha sp. (ex Codakia rugifera)]|nr:paraquat-inducible protein A [Candidatus Thiodiazotropha sp. (ex Codakia rugifera)]
MIERNEAEHLVIPEYTARWLRWLLLLTSCLLMAGLYMPMVTLTKFLFIANSFSVLSGVQELFNREQWFLFLIVGIFSVILPVLKIVLLYLLLHYREIRTAQFGHLLKMMHDYGRWAMLDVMVVAVMIVTVKLGVIAEIEIHTGLYLFGAAVLLIMYITHRVVRYTQIP